MDRKDRDSLDSPRGRSARGGPIKICWIIPTLDRGGAEKQLTLLSCGIDREKFDPMVIALTRGGPYRQTLRDAGVPVYEINKRGKLDPLAFGRLRRLLRQLRPDVVHTWLFAANAYGRLAALRAGVPVVLGGERCVDPWKRGWELRIDRLLASRTAGVLTNSTAVRDFYAAAGIDPAKFTVIPNGIEPAGPTRLSREQALASLGLRPDARFILSVGRLWPQKGYKDLVWAGGMACVVDPTLAYVIVGEGPQRPMLEKFCDDTGSAAVVKLVGERDDAADLMPHCELFWNGSHYEGQSNSILEAMRAGAAVIASDIPGNRDLIEHGRDGLLYPAGAVDQLLKLTTLLKGDPQLRGELAAAAQQKVEQEFSVERMVRRHEETYEAALARVSRW